MDNKTTPTAAPPRKRGRPPGQRQPRRHLAYYLSDAEIARLDSEVAALGTDRSSLSREAVLYYLDLISGTDDHRPPRIVRRLDDNDPAIII